MKVLSKTVLREKQRIQSERQKAALEAKLNAMTPEEREQYDKEQEENRKKAMEALRNYALVSSMVRSDYSK